MPEQSKRRRGRKRTAAATLLLAYAALAMERADSALLPAVYREIGAALQASPTALGSIALSRSVVQAACYPLAAYLAARHDRLTVIALGAFLWAAATLLIGLSTTFAQAELWSLRKSNDAILQMAVTAALNGVGLALQIPAIFAFVADSVDGTNRGMAFGWLMVASKAGTVGGTTLGLLMAPTSFFGVPGWRLAFLLLAALVGFSHGETAALMTLFKVATSLGGLFGGKMGDVLAGRLKNSGRIILAQISAGSAIPLAGVLLLALPSEPATFAHHGAALFVMGFMASWNTSATNSPILAEIVPPRSRTSVYALDRTFEAVLASFAPPVVGMLAEHLYGYKLVRSAAGGAGHAASVETDRHNATSLARALYTAIAIPMALCCLVYSFLYCTYPRDRDLARAETARDGGGARPGGEGSDTEDEGEEERELLPL
ncbi:hypothetical protein TRIUR3_13541 [Triticum urartu]|uniref:Major facilitator superfamily (MFS) profile domain-containing protein n=1 Tax=Triticum urartu TaxID=4572 RepID=M7YU89_TRIUA|nr:hypothetical protein TRIUR3_13541 [Triticum urartu]